jgi:hypothetical protein
MLSISEEWKVQSRISKIPGELMLFASIAMKTKGESARPE